MSALMNSAVVNKLIYYHHESQQPRKSISTVSNVINSEVGQFFFIFSLKQTKTLGLQI